MFDRVAGRYDILNRLLSAGRDAAWRRMAVAALSPLPANPRALDLCAGTMDFALTLREEYPSARILAVDFSLPMLRKGFAKRGSEGLRTACADALRLPLRDAGFDALLCGFGVRNFESPAAGLAEMRRVLAPGGRAAVLEFFAPTTRTMRFFHESYARFVIPAMGRLVSDEPSAYRYLPASMRDFYTAEEFCGAMRNAGFGNVKAVPLDYGIAWLVTGEAA